MPPRELHIIFTPRMKAECFSFNFFVGTEYLLHIRVDFPTITCDKKVIILRKNYFIYFRAQSYEIVQKKANG